MSATQLNTFSFEGKGNIRTILNGDGPWFISKDICTLLAISNPTDAMKDLEEEEKMTLANPESHSGKRGGARSYACVNESGLYALIFKSRKPEAKRFRKWVTSEVLPAIRKTGKFEAKQTDAEKFMAGTYRNTKEMKEMIGDLTNAIAQLVSVQAKGMSKPEPEKMPEPIQAELIPSIEVAPAVPGTVVKPAWFTMIEDWFTLHGKELKFYHRVDGSSYGWAPRMEVIWGILPANAREDARFKSNMRKMRDFLRFSTFLQVGPYFVFLERNSVKVELPAASQGKLDFEETA